MATCVLAGDIGGTKTDLALYAVEGPERLALVRDASLASHEFAGLEDAIARFLAGERAPIGAAAFGVAGPVLDGVARITNLPWRVDVHALERATRCPRVRLMNDLETTAYGALFAAAADLLVLNRGTPRVGTRAVIAAGTGLGEALLWWDGRRYHPSASEGGHVDFGPNDEREIGLLRFLRRELPRVTWERVVSGPGLHNIFRYLDEDLRRPVEAAVRERMRVEDPSAVIGAAGLDGSCPTCAEAVAMLVHLYGAQAGNLALTAMAIGGVYIGGGITTKLLPAITGGAFVAGFTAKEPHRAVMERVPVWVLLNPKTSRLGAAHAACELLA
jgi:glucokinase